MCSGLRSSRSLLAAAIRLLQVFCQRTPVALRVSQDYCTSLWRSVTIHLALSRYLHALWRAMTASMFLTLRVGTRTIVYLEFYVETVPCTNRTHKVIRSPRRAREMEERAFANFKKEHASKILDPHHRESVRVHAIGWKIIRAIRRVLSIKRKIERQGQEPLQKMTRLGWIRELNLEVIVVEENVGTAKCFPGGGKIVLYTGLLDHFSTDAEIATIIAHEVGHIIARHSSEMTKIFKWWLPTRLLVTPLLQRNELEADYIGMLLQAAAGFDPHAAPMSLEKEGRINRKSTLKKLLSFFSFSAHPCTKKRSQLLSQPKVMEEAMELYREATSDGPANLGCSSS
ncbi:hypothetical protein ACQJBY_018018 [Aegilops geniculata]